MRLFSVLPIKFYCVERQKILLFFILRAQEKRDAKQDEREQNYQKIIEGLTQKLNIVADMQGNIERIRDAVTTHRYETDDP